MTMIEKPSKFTRRSVKVDMSGLALPKDPPSRNATYRAWIRSQPCSLIGFGGHVCQGPIQCAHVGKRGLGSKESDYFTISFCERAHAIQTHEGWAALCVNYDFNPWEFVARFLERWNRRTEKE